MNTLPLFRDEVACDDLHPYGSAATDQAPRLQNPGKLGVVTIGDHGEFVSRRPLDDAELAQAYAEHAARHGLA